MHTIYFFPCFIVLVARRRSQALLQQTIRPSRTPRQNPARSLWPMDSRANYPEASGTQNRAPRRRTAKTRRSGCLGRAAARTRTAYGAAVCAVFWAGWSGRSRRSRRRSPSRRQPSQTAWATPPWRTTRGCPRIWARAAPAPESASASRTTATATRTPPSPAPSPTGEPSTGAPSTAASHPPRGLGLAFPNRRRLSKAPANPAGTATDH